MIKGAQETEVDGKVKLSTYPRRKDIGSGETEPERNEIALFFGMEYFNNLTSLFKTARCRGPQPFFEQFGYLFFDCSKAERLIESDRKTIQYVWMTELAEYSVLRTDEFPDMKVLRCSSADPLLDNTSVFKKFLGDRTELNMLVSHEVWIYKSAKADAKRIHRGTEIALLKKNVSMLTVALRLVGGFASYDLKDMPLTAILGVSGSSLKVCTTLRLGFAIFHCEVCDHTGINGGAGAVTCRD